MNQETFTFQFDLQRVESLLSRVTCYLTSQSHDDATGGYRTLREIVAMCGGSEAGVSARLRELRHDGLVVERRRRGEPRKGIWEYRVLVPAAVPIQ